MANADVARSLGPEAPAPIRVCPACGVIAPLEGAACVICSHGLGANVPVAAGGGGGVVWACVAEADVVCRVCGLRTPVHGVHLANELTCERCGMTQSFDPSQWADGLKHAHQVAATCGPRVGATHAPSSPTYRCPLCGRENPAGTRFCYGCGSAYAEAPSYFTAIGLSKTFAEHTQQVTVIMGGTSNSLTLRVKAAPGHPLCTSCYAPLAVELDGHGRMRTTCGRCASAIVYALPAGALSVYGALAGVLAPEHRSDRPRAVVERSPGSALAALKCPSCGANVALSGPAEIVTCGHCQTSSLVPRQALTTPGSAPKPTPFWVLFRWPLPRAAPAATSAPEGQHAGDAARQANRVGLIIAAAVGIPIVIGIVIVVVVLVVVFVAAQGQHVRH